MHIASILDFIGFGHLCHTAFFHNANACDIVVECTANDLAKSDLEQVPDQSAQRLGHISHREIIGIKSISNLNPVAVYLGIIDNADQSSIEKDAVYVSVLTGGKRQKRIK